MATGALNRVIQALLKIIDDSSKLCITSLENSIDILKPFDFPLCFRNVVVHEILLDQNP